jgi:hypothetical protein
VATLIDKEVDTKSAAAQLGRASEEVTDTYLIAKPVSPPTSPTSSNHSAPAEDPTNAGPTARHRHHRFVLRNDARRRRRT